MFYNFIENTKLHSNAKNTSVISYHSPSANESHVWACCWFRSEAKTIPWYYSWKKMRKWIDYIFY